MSHTHSPSSSTSSCVPSRHVSFYHLANVIPDGSYKQRRLSSGSSRLPRIVSKTYTVPLPTASAISKSFGLRFGRDCSDDDRDDDPTFIPNCPRRFFFRMPLFSTEPPLPHLCQHELKSCLRSPRSPSFAPVDANNLPELTYTQSRDTSDTERCPIVTETSKKRRRSSTLAATPTPTPNDIQSSCLSQSPEEMSSLESVASPMEIEGDSNLFDFDLRDEQLVVSGRAIQLKPCCSACLKAHAKGLLPDPEYKEYWSPRAKSKRRQDLNMALIRENLKNSCADGSFKEYLKRSYSDSSFKDINGVDEMDNAPLETRMKFEENSKVVEEEEFQEDLEEEEEEDEEDDLCVVDPASYNHPQMNECFKVMYTHSDTDLLKQREEEKMSATADDPVRDNRDNLLMKHSLSLSTSSINSSQQGDLPMIHRTGSLNMPSLSSSQSPTRKSFSTLFLPRRSLNESPMLSPLAVASSREEKGNNTTTSARTFKDIKLGVPSLRTALQGYRNVFAPSATMATHGIF